MMPIIDRRFDAKKKSTVNRERFMKRFKDQIGQKVKDLINGRTIDGIDDGGNISIPGKDTREHQIVHNPDGVRKHVVAGNDERVVGDEFERPQGGSGRGSSGSDGGESEDDFVFTLSREELLHIFFEDLQLPNLIKTQLIRIVDWKSVHAGFTHSDSTTMMNLKQTFKKARGRWLGMGHKPLLMDMLTRLLSLLERSKRRGDPEVETVVQEIHDYRITQGMEPGGETSLDLRLLSEELDALRVQKKKIPYLDTVDIIRRVKGRQPKPSAQAVMFCLMDVSGSMTEEIKQIAKRFFMLLYLFLTKKYQFIDIVFIRHHTVAKETNEEDFFRSRESGGTVASSALRLMLDIVRDRYASGQWNIYAAQASDGDNWDNDSVTCRDLLVKEILPLVQYFAYIEVGGREPQNLWQEYAVALNQGVKNFAMRRVEGVQDIYPVFRDLFKKNHSERMAS